MTGVRRWTAGLTVFVCYLVGAVVLTIGAWSDPTSGWAGGCCDQEQTIWYLGWAPHALTHGLNPFFTTQIGKGTVASGTNLYMGTAALSERDYVHEAIDRADLIIAIGHDTIEKPPFFMGQHDQKVLHISYMPANVEQVYYPDAEVVGDLGPTLKLLQHRYDTETKL